MRKVTTVFLTIILALGLVIAAGCKERESDAGKQIKRTMDRAQDAVDKVNKRQEDSIPKE